MQGDDGAEVHLRQDVAIEDHDRIGHLLAAVSDGAPGAERRRFDDVPDRDAEIFPVTDDVLDAARLVVQAENDLVNLRHLPDEIELVVKERPIEDRHDRLRGMDGQGTQAGALATGQQ